MGVPGSVETERKKTPEERTISLETGDEQPDKTTHGRGGGQGGYRGQEAQGRGDAPGEQGISPPRSSKGALQRFLETVTRLSERTGKGSAGWGQFQKQTMTHSVFNRNSFSQYKNPLK